MMKEHRLVQRPMLLGLSAILAIALGFTALVSYGGAAFAQTPSGTSTATTTATTPSPAATTPAATSTQSGSTAASPTAPTTGSAGPSDSSSNSALILVGGLAVVGISLAAMGYSLRKRA